MVLARQRLRRAALRMAARGWPVTPGAWLRADRFDCGRLGCPTTACHPALDGWEQAASVDPDRIAQWWRSAPHGVLLATGLAFDVLEVPAPLGALAVAAAPWRRVVRGPVATVSTGRWMFFVRTGRPLLPELADRPDVIRHSRGSWVPAPPTCLVDSPVRWSVPPSAVGWRLPDGYAVQRLLLTGERAVTGAPDRAGCGSGRCRRRTGRSHPARGRSARDCPAIAGNWPESALIDLKGWRRWPHR